MDPVTQHLISSYLLMPVLTVIFGIAAYFIARKNKLLNNKKLIVYLLLCGIVLALPGAYFHQRTIRTFIQRSRLSLVARGSSGHRQFTGKHPHNLPTRSHASSCSDRRRRKYHFKQDTFRYHHPTETGRNHGFVNRYHHFGSQL